MVAVAFSVSLEDRVWCLEQGRCVPTSDLSSSGLRWSFWASNLVFHLSSGRNDSLSIISDELGRRWWWDTFLRQSFRKKTIEYRHQGPSACYPYTLPRNEENFFHGCHRWWSTYCAFCLVDWLVFIFFAHSGFFFFQLSSTVASCHILEFTCIHLIGIYWIAISGRLGQFKAYSVVIREIKDSMGTWSQGPLPGLRD